MKKLFLYIFLGLMFCNVGFADQLSKDGKCKRVSYITVDGFKKYKVVCGAKLSCDSKYEKSSINFTFDFKNGTMVESRKDRKDWLTNIVGDLKSGIFTYGIHKSSSDGMNEYVFYVMTSNLDNHFDIIIKEGNALDYNKILRILQKIDGNISRYEYITVPSNRNRNNQKEKEKFDSIFEFMSNLKDWQTENLKCHGI
tara:strand:+ start:176 stop:766 length:591 start_codon:yes stop_codon:yes gene_type:complete